MVFCLFMGVFRTKSLPGIFENFPEKYNDAAGVFVLQKMQKPWNKSVCVRSRKLCDLRMISKTVEHGTKSVK